MTRQTDRDGWRETNDTDSTHSVKKKWIFILAREPEDGRENNKTEPKAIIAAVLWVFVSHIVAAGTTEMEAAAGEPIEGSDFPLVPVVPKPPKREGNKN